VLIHVLGHLHPRQGRFLSLAIGRLRSLWVLVVSLSQNSPLTTTVRVERRHSAPEVHFGCWRAAFSLPLACSRNEPSSRCHLGLAVSSTVKSHRHLVRPLSHHRKVTPGRHPLADSQILKPSCLSQAFSSIGQSRP